jgi:hypothetical protein
MFFEHAVSTSNTGTFGADCEDIYMLDSFKVQLSLPATAYALAGTPVNSILRGSSLNSAVYIVDPADHSALSGVHSMMHTTSLTRRSPGQSGSNRAQLLSQAVLLDVNGRPVVISYNQTITVANYFAAPEGLTVDIPAVAEAVVGMGVGYLLNPGNSESAGQDATLKSLILGVAP